MTDTLRAALEELTRAVADAKASRTALGYDEFLLRVIAQTVIRNWPALAALSADTAGGDAIDLAGRIQAVATEAQVFIPEAVLQEMVAAVNEALVSSPATGQAADLRAFGASDAACYLWPDDTEIHKACRAAYCQGAVASFPAHTGQETDQWRELASYVTGNPNASAAEIQKEFEKQRDNLDDEITEHAVTQGALERALATGQEGAMREALKAAREFVAGMLKPAKYPTTMSISSYSPCQELLDKISAALASSPAVQEAAGWKLVPVDPNEEMLCCAANHMCHTSSDFKEQARVAYREMLAASTAPSTSEDVIDDLMEALWKIQQWAEAYPIEVFPEPDMKRAIEGSISFVGGLTIAVMQVPPCMTAFFSAA